MYLKLNFMEEIVTIPGSWAGMFVFIEKAPELLAALPPGITANTVVNKIQRKHHNGAVKYQYYQEVNHLSVEATQTLAADFKKYFYDHEYQGEDMQELLQYDSDNCYLVFMMCEKYKNYQADAPKTNPILKHLDIYVKNLTSRRKHLVENLKEIRDNVAAFFTKSKTKDPIHPSPPVIEYEMNLRHTLPK